MSTAAYPATGSRPAVNEALGFIDTPLRRVGAVLMFLFLFFLYSRALDLKLAFLHLPFYISLMALTAAALSGGLPRALMSRVGVILSALTVWMVLCVPFAFWRAHSVELLSGKWLKMYLLAVLLIGLLGTVKECRTALNSIAYGTVAVSLLALWINQHSRGRLLIPQTAMNNPNDLAQVLLMGFPFLVILAFPGSGPFRRAFAILSVPVVFYVILKTGSRGALVAIAITSVLVFLRASILTKMKLVALGGIVLIGMVLSLPGEVRSRYMTIFSGTSARAYAEADTGDDATAIASSSERKEILLQAIRITVRHPLFGVGPDNFPSFAAIDSHEKGRRARWRVTHNTFLQWSSECGIPGLFLFLAGLVSCFRYMAVIVKQSRGRIELREVGYIAGAMQFSLVTYGITSMFASTAYEALFPTLAGISMAFTYAVQRELPAAAPAPAPLITIPRFLRRRPAALPVAVRR